MGDMLLKKRRGAQKRGQTAKTSQITVIVAAAVSQTITRSVAAQSGN
jgi:hypothetical protein